MPPHACGQLRGAAAADADEGFGLRWTDTLPGENLDHPPDGIRPIERRSRPAQDFDALDLIEGQILERGQSQSRRPERHAIDQQKRMAGSAAAGKETGDLARATLRCDLQTRLLGQQLRQGRCAGGFDGGTVDHGDIGELFADTGRDSCRRDDDGRLVLDRCSKSGLTGDGKRGGDGRARKMILHCGLPVRPASPQAGDKTNAQGMTAWAETIRRRTAPRSAFNWIVRGRSPGSEVLLPRLPGNDPSGWMRQPHFLTVAGAAQALSWRRTCFPFHLPVLQPARHRGRSGRIIGGAVPPAPTFRATLLRHRLHKRRELLDQ